MVVASMSDRPVSDRPGADRPSPRRRWQWLADPSNPHRLYSRFVRVMKIGLLVGALVMLAVVVIWPKMVMDDDKFRVGFAKLAPDAVQSLAMIKARYYGLDSNNRPYTVTADRATPRGLHTEIYDLVSPVADFMNKNGVPIIVQATTGVLHQKEHFLDLAGKVDLYQAQGYELHTSAARVNFKTNQVTGSRPVTGQGPPGHVTGQGFEILDGGVDVRVNGKSTLTLDGRAVPDKAGGAATQGEGR
jgi:lipopolysaccharide export system protein LptC